MNVFGSVSIFLTLLGDISPLMTASDVSSPIARRSNTNFSVLFCIKYCWVRFVASVGSEKFVCYVANEGSGQGAIKCDIG